MYRFRIVSRSVVIMFLQRDKFTQDADQLAKGQDTNNRSHPLLGGSNKGFGGGGTLCMDETSCKVQLDQNARYPDIRFTPENGGGFRTRGR